MKFYIKHESRGRIRIHLAQKRMSSVQAETLLYYLQNQNQVSFAKVYDRTGDAVICYEGERAAVIRMIQLFHYEEVELPTGLLESSGRALNNEYQEKLISKDDLPLWKKMASSGTDPCHLYYGCFRKIYLERNPDTGTGKDRSSGS